MTIFYSFPTRGNRLVFIGKYLVKCTYFVLKTYFESQNKNMYAKDVFKGDTFIAVKLTS